MASTLQMEIQNAWAVLSKHGVVPHPNASLSEALDHALNNCPTCVSRRASKAASMRRYRDNKASRAKRAKRKKK